MSSRFTEILFIAVEVSRLLGSLIGGAPWCEVLLIGVAPWWWLVFELVVELLEIILVKGVVYCTTLGLCVARCRLWASWGRWEKQGAARRDLRSRRYQAKLDQLNLRIGFYLFSAFPPFDGKGVAVG